MATLSQEQVARFERDGIVFPLRCFPAGAMAAYAARFAAAERRDGGTLLKRHNEKPHLLMRWLNDLMREPAILDSVEALIGPDILVWQSGFFAKKPGDGGFVSWHQDSTYWGLSSPDVVSAWIAFTPSNPSNGCMRVVPGSHLRDQLPHADTFADGNMLSRGQEVAVDVDERDALDVILEPGEMSLHHVRIIHGSKANMGAQPRIGFTVRYIPTRVRQTSGVQDSATLVRGTDVYRHFESEPVPMADFDPDAVAYHSRMLGWQAELRYAGAQRGPTYESVTKTP
jgi:non-haem Fe2+, alpha-ketoglutarate-dependent halogenase